MKLCPKCGYQYEGDSCPRCIVKQALVEVKNQDQDLQKNYDSDYEILNLEPKRKPKLLYFLVLLLVVGGVAYYYLPVIKTYFKQPEVIEKHLVAEDMIRIGQKGVGYVDVPASYKNYRFTDSQYHINDLVAYSDYESGIINMIVYYSYELKSYDISDDLDVECNKLLEQYRQNYGEEIMSEQFKTIKVSGNIAQCVFIYFEDGQVDYRWLFFDEDGHYHDIALSTYEMEVVDADALAQKVIDSYSFTR